MNARAWYHRLQIAALPTHGLPLTLATLLIAGLIIIVPQRIARTALTHLVLQETQLKQRYSAKLQQTPSSAALQTQRQEMHTQVALLEQDEEQERTQQQESLSIAIDTLARTRGLHLSQLKPQAEDRAQDYVRQPLRLSANGSYQAILYFIRDIADLPHSVTLDQLQLQASSAASKPDNAASTLLTLQATISSYRYLPLAAHSDEH